MASCVRCGKYRIRKNLQGIFYCRRCGPRHSDVLRVRAAEQLAASETPDPARFVCASTEAPF